MDIKTKIGNLKLDNFIMNASGPLCTSLEELLGIQESYSGAIVTKSCTIDYREGNEKPRYVELELGSINSMGLPNLGYKKYGEFSKILKEKSKKPIIVNIAGLKKEDFPRMLKEFQENEAVDLIEVNLSCPNVVGKPQIAYDFETTNEILGTLDNIGNKDIGVKIPPYFDFVHIEKMSEIISKHNVKFVTCINSVGNTLFIDPEKEEVVIKPKGGFGGLGGDYIKPIALANTRKFYELIGDKVDIIGVGGIKSGIDAFEFILAGASAVQLGTVYSKNGVGCFEKITKEFIEYASKKGYKSIEEIKGKLKTL